MRNKEYSRRKFISKCIGSSSIFMAGGALIFSSCDSNKSNPADKKQTSATNFCDDLSNVSKSELEKRKTFAYVDRSPLPDRSCGNCALFVPKTDNQSCGECMLFKGPVRAAGHCIQWASKEQP
ncbi:high-potential iron-sulfur protein [Segetibacter koreensis]|uniref:high-potential iron-sulfur protein n=1 Tax=Segetibacter koreensis TaxID=398037 RepID=UPI00037E2D90|nr:high-potential iron-sulfur protein [Segetibacter koreensis]